MGSNELLKINLIEKLNIEKNKLFDELKETQEIFENFKSCLDETNKILFWCEEKKKEEPNSNRINKINKLIIRNYRSRNYLNSLIRSAKTIIILTTRKIRNIVDKILILSNKKLN